MLVLTRRAGESIMIDGQIELKVLRIKGSQVHLGIEAPRETAIHRKEVWVRLRRMTRKLKAPRMIRLSGPSRSPSPETTALQSRARAPRFSDATRWGVKTGVCCGGAPIHARVRSPAF